MRDEVLGDAIMWRLQTLAEAATSKLSAGFRDAHPDVDWQSIAGFRNIAAHGYLQLDWDEVTRIIEGDLPILRRIVEKELS